MPRLTALKLLSTVLDKESFVSWDSEPRPQNLSSTYVEQLAGARDRSSVDEAVLTGEGQLNGRRVAVIVSEFDFLAGSAGAVVAERVTAAFERATREQLTVLASPASGGTRMHEGTPAFLQMIKISQAVEEHRRAGLPYLVYLRNPTTGGVLASWGSLGDFSVAEPNALIGFLGPRVRKAIYGEALPEGIQVAENLVHRGVIDGIVSLAELREVAINALEVLTTPQNPTHTPTIEPDLEELAGRSAWTSVVATRSDGRPGLRDLLHHCAETFIPLRGTGRGESDLTIVMGLVRFPGFSCVLVGQDRKAQRYDHLGAAALRVAERGVGLAERLGLPILTVIDTPGAALSTDAEQGGISGEIARCLTALATVHVPVVSIVLGEGAGGAALALMPADRTISAEHGWIAPLPPEGASAITHRSTKFASQMAQNHHIRSIDLRRIGVVDQIVAENPDAGEEPAVFCRRVLAAATTHLSELLDTPRAERLSVRRHRYRTIGMETMFSNLNEQVPESKSNTGS